MSERIIDISKSLWLDMSEVEHDGLFFLQDDTGGNTLVAIEEIPTLIEALRSIEAQKQEVSK